MALVLSRKEGQAVEIGGVTVMVARISGRRVRLAISAPITTPIRRSELDPFEAPGYSSGKPGNCANDNSS